MKKYLTFLTAALVVLGCWASCSDDEALEPQKSITLTEPAANAAYNLEDVNSVEFSWTVQGAISGSYKLLLSKTDDLANAVEKDAPATPFTVSANDLDNMMGVLGVASGETPIETTVFWSIAVGEVKAKARAIKLTRIPVIIPEITLASPGPDAAINLGTVTEISFNWNVMPTGAVENVVLVIGGAEDLSDGTSIPVQDKPFVVPASQLDGMLALANILKGQSVPLYWSIRPAEASVEARTYIRGMTVTRVPVPEIMLTAPADNASVDLSGGNPVVFEWNATPDVTAYKLRYSLSSDLSNALEVENLSATSYSITATDFNAALLAAGAGEGAPVTVYWSVVQQNPTEQATPQTRNLQVSLITFLQTPANDAEILLDHNIPTSNAVTFSWANTGAAGYELLISKNRDLSDAIAIAVTGTSKAFTHADLQTYIGTSKATKKYKSNMLYWNVKADGTPIATVPKIFTLSGYRQFTYPDGNTYSVSIVPLAGDKAGQQAVWLSNNLKETNSITGSPLGQGSAGLTISEHIVRDFTSEANYPDELKPYAGYHYIHEKMADLKTLIVPQGWKYPTYTDFSDLLEAALASPSGIWVLALEGLAGYTGEANLWKLNMANYGRSVWSTSDLEIQAFSNVEQKNLYFSYDVTADDNPNQDGNNTICIHWAWNAPALTTRENHGYVPVRLMYIGDDE
jgi:hypothetical protein